MQRSIETTIGTLHLIASEKGLQCLLWEDPLPKDLLRSSNKENIKKSEEILSCTEKQVREYLEGKRKTFDIPLDIQGTEFQKRVWQRLQKIPYGKTKSYKDIATELDDPKACRAVGTANGKNPVPIIIPCHRVISSDGSMGGFAWGLELKSKLLDIECR